MICSQFVNTVINHLVEGEGDGRCSVAKHRLAIDGHVVVCGCAAEHLGGEEQHGAGLVVGGGPLRLLFLTPVLHGDALQDDLLYHPHLCEEDRFGYDGLSGWC